MASTLRKVIAYVWWVPDDLAGLALLCEQKPAYVVKDAYWNGSIEERDGKKFIIVPEQFRSLRLPDAELLECRHERPFIYGRRNRHWFNERRRCVICAMEGVPRG